MSLKKTMIAVAAVLAVPVVALAQPANTTNDNQATPSSPPASGVTPPQSTPGSTTMPPAAVPTPTPTVPNSGSRALSPNPPVKPDGNQPGAGR